MPVEYWNPVSVYYDDVSNEEFQKIKKEIYDNIKDDMYSENQWKDLVQTTNKFSTNIVKVLNLVNLQTLILKHTHNYLSHLNIKRNFYIHDSWFNILPKYGHQMTHIHLNYPEVYSGVYFYENNNQKMQPLCFEMKNDVSQLVVDYEYVPGRIIIFSGKLPHRVHFNDQEEHRKSFSFNVILV